jgi:hypothetical protein
MVKNTYQAESDLLAGSLGASISGKYTEESHRRSEIDDAFDPPDRQRRPIRFEDRENIFGTLGAKVFYPLRKTLESESSSRVLTSSAT